MDELDRILSSEPAIQPSPHLQSRVMQAVAREQGSPPPIGFPWKWAVPGLAGCVLAIAVTAVLAVIEGPPSQVPDWSRWLDDAQTVGLASLAGSLVLSRAFYRLSMTLAGGR